MRNKSAHSNWFSEAKSRIGQKCAIFRVERKKNGQKVKCGICFTV